MQSEPASEIGEAPIHDVKAACLGNQDVEHIDLSHLAVADVNESRNRPAQIQQRVHLYRRLGGAKRGPVEQAQAQVDGSGVQRVNRRIESQPRRFLGVKIASSQDQAHGQRVINVPIPLIQCVRERGSGRYAAQAHMEQLALVGGQTGFDVAQRLAPCQLRESHHAKQVGATQGAHSRIAAVAVDDATECLPRHVLHDLRKQRFAHVHTSPQFF